jgi:hypothetical protein
LNGGYLRVLFGGCRLVCSPSRIECGSELHSATSVLFGKLARRRKVALDGGLSSFGQRVDRRLYIVLIALLRSDL